MNFCDFKMKQRRAEIIERHPRMAEPTFAAALANRVISECWAYMFADHGFERHAAARGYFGDDAENLKARIAKERAEYENSITA